jgi:DNA-binding response OmpR family regulator
MSRILIVEDDIAIADLEKDYLELSDFEVDIETNGKAGLQAALTKDYDLFILDHMLPDVDGFEFVQNVRELNSEIPILFMTASGPSTDSSSSPRVFTLIRTATTRQAKLTATAL